MWHKASKICIIGLGYVGYPLAVAFAEKFNVIGFDINTEKIKQLHSDFAANNNLIFTSSQQDVRNADIYIITVPTPLNAENKLDLSFLENACNIVGNCLKIGNLVIIESTVYPGITEEFCIPILEKISNLNCNKDFYVGYSPERINPGDTKHTLTNIVKITSGSTPEAAKAVEELYQTIITAGTYLAPSIKIAEAAKIVENAQRDINIAFMNELSVIFNKSGLDSNAILQAAATKWNFLPFRPGLVGGYCVGAAPHYLAQYAQNNGYTPQLILTGRAVNDNMSHFVATEVLRLLLAKDIVIHNAEILVLGFTFKENCTEIRNSKVAEIITALQKQNTKVSVYDPNANSEAVQQLYGFNLLQNIPENKQYDAIILAVAHDAFNNFNYAAHLKSLSVLFDTKRAIKGLIADGGL